MRTTPVTELGSNVTGATLARILDDNTLLLQQSLQRLTTGVRIISPGDDPAGLGISVKLNNEMRRVSASQTSISNAQDFTTQQSDLLTTVSDSLSRMSELATLAQGTLTADVRSSYITEFSQLQVFISATGTKSFNNLSLFNAGAKNVVVDQNGSTYTMNGINYSAAAGSGGLAGAFSGINLSSVANASSAASAVSLAIQNLGIMQAQASSYNEILGFYDDGLDSLSDNLNSVHNRIVGVDTATETAEFNRLSLLAQTDVSLLVQWNTLHLGLLSLFE